jgi:phosphate:Na+ symporter
MTLCNDALTQMVTVMSNQRQDHDIRETYCIENDINLMRQQLRNENIRAVNEREYDYVIGTIYIDLINECEILGDYVVNVVEARFGR